MRQREQVISKIIKSFSPCWVVARWRDPQVDVSFSTVCSWPSVWWQQIWGPIMLPSVTAEKHIERQQEPKWTGGWWSVGLSNGKKVQEGITVGDLGERRLEASGWLRPFSVVSWFPLAFRQSQCLRAERIFGNPVFFMGKMKFKGL